MILLVFFFGLCFLGLGDCETVEPIQTENIESPKENYDYEVCNLENRCYMIDVHDRIDYYLMDFNTPTQGRQIHNHEIEDGEFPNFQKFCELGYDFSEKGTCYIQLQILDLVKRVSNLENLITKNQDHVELSGLDEKILQFKNECENDDNLFYFNSQGYPQCNHNDHSHSMLVQLNLKDEWWLDIGYESLENWCNEARNGVVQNHYDYTSCTYEQNGLTAGIYLYDDGGLFEQLEELKPKIKSQLQIRQNVKDVPEN